MEYAQKLNIVPFLKSFKPATNAGSAIIQQALLKKGTQHVISVHILQEQVFPVFLVYVW
jgi:hypothetical protein